MQDLLAWGAFALGSFCPGTFVNVCVFLINVWTNFFLVKSNILLITWKKYSVCIQNCRKNYQWWIKTHFWAHRTIIWTNDPQGSKFCFESLSTIRWFIFRFPSKSQCKNRCNFLWYSSINRRFTNISILHWLLHRFWLYIHMIVFIRKFIKK